MSIPYCRTIDYLSPSSLMQLESDSIEFYLQRLGPEEYRPPRSPATLAMEIGTAFDAIVKGALAAELRLECPSPESMMSGLSDEARRIGTQAFFGYQQSGAYDALLAEGVVAVEREIRRTITVDGVEVPLRGDLDCVIESGALDWKVTRHSPCQGYDEVFDSRSPCARLRGHKRAGEPFEVLNERWATQLGIYQIVLGRVERDPAACIDQIVVKPNYVRVCRFRNRLTNLDGLRRRLRDAWETVEEERVVPADLVRDVSELELVF